MKTITVKVDRWEAIFQEALEKLELQNLRDETFNRTGRDLRTEELHRKFHFEVCCLKSELEKS